MEAILDRHDTTAFASRLARSSIGTTTLPHADVFARDDRHSTSYTFSQAYPRRINLSLQLEDQAVVLTYLDVGRGLPAWATPVLRSLSERWGVKPGWDTYDAQSTSIRHVALLLNYLFELMDDDSAAPIITPLSDGGVQAEWHQDGNELELVVPTNEPARYYYYNATSKVEEAENLEPNFARARQLIGQF